MTLDVGDERPMKRIEPEIEPEGKEEVGGPPRGDQLKWSRKGGEYGEGVFMCTEVRKGRKG